MDNERVILVASIALRKSSTDYMKLLPLGSRGFKPDQARNFRTTNVSSDSPGFSESSMGPTGMMPGMGSMLNSFMAMAQMQMQMQMHMAQQQQQMWMQNMGSSGNVRGPSFNTGMLHLLSCSNKSEIL